MATEIVVPALGESVTTATVARWMKQQGEPVAADEPLVELETDKVTVEVNAPSAGVLTRSACPKAPRSSRRGARRGRRRWRGRRRRLPRPRRSRACRQSAGRHQSAAASAGSGVAAGARPRRRAHAPLPAAAKMIAEKQASRSADLGAGTGKDGRITKGDVLDFLVAPAPAPRRSAGCQAARARMSRASSA